MGQAVWTTSFVQWILQGDLSDPEERWERQLENITCSYLGHGSRSEPAISAAIFLFVGITSFVVKLSNCRIRSCGGSHGLQPWLAADLVIFIGVSGGQYLLVGRNGWAYEEGPAVGKCLVFARYGDMSLNALISSLDIEVVWNGRQLYDIYVLQDRVYNE